MAKVLITCALLLASTILFGLFSFQNQSKIDALEKSKDRGKLTWYAELAKAKGDQEIRFHAPLVRYSVPRSLEAAQTYYNFLVVQPLESKSFVSEDSIRTWYKFRIVEELSSPVERCHNCPGLDAAPNELLPLKQDEFLAIQNGGEVEVDGIRVMSQDTKYPAFKIGKRYLLFVSLDSQKTTGAFKMGPWGTFGVGADESLLAVDESLHHPIQEQLKNGFGNSLLQLRSGLSKNLK